MPMIRVFFGGHVDIRAENEAHAKELFRANLREYVTGDTVEVQDTDELRDDDKPSFIPLGQSREWSK
jgi:hypothetical protein